MPKALIVEILADAKQFGHELDRAAGKTRQMGKVAGVAGLAIAGGLAVGLEKSVKAAMDAQVSTAKLDQAFKSSHDNIEKYSHAISGAESSGRNLGFSNTEIRDSLGSLEIATHNGTKAIRDLGIAEDIARFKHVGLADASKMLTMAMAGSQRATKALGLSLQPVTVAEDRVKAAFKDHTTAAYAAALATAKLQDKQATASQVIDLVGQKLHGQAQAFADTAQGGMAKFHAQTEALQENLGAALLPAIVAITDKLAALTGWLAKHTTVAKILVGVVAALAAGLLALSAATWAVNVAMDANPIGAVIVGVVALTAAIIILVTHWKQVKEWIVSHWPEVAAVMLLPIAPIISVGLAIYALRNKIKDALSEVVDFVKGPFVSAFDAMKGPIMHAWDGIKAIWNATLGGAIGDMIRLIKELISIAEKAAGVLQALASAASTIGDVIHGRGTRNLPPGVGPRGQGGPRPRRHALGGIFTGPTLLGNDLFGEAGPEALIPLSSPQAQGMLGGHVTVNVGPVYGTADAAFARKLSDQLATQLRSGRAPQLQQAIHAI